MPRKRSSLLLRAVCAVVVLVLSQSPVHWLVAQHSTGVVANSGPSIEASAWPQADQLFRSDPLWLGGDAAFSVDLGRGRVLWMFGDSFVSASAGATRRQAAFIRNTVAIQTDYDPSRATIEFYSGQRAGRPSDFAPSGDSTWLWPMGGIRLGNRLLLFYMRLARDPNKNSLGFQSVGWSAFIVVNPDAEPSAWNLHKLAGPETRGRMLIGMSVIRFGGGVYAFVLNSDNHDTYLLRWPFLDAATGHLSFPQWWCGDHEGWQSSPAHRQAVIRDAGSEFSVQRDPKGGFLEVNSAGFGGTTIVFRRAVHLEGPWSEPQNLFRPPESDVSGLLVYGGKAHPELSGAEVVVTYAANGSDERLTSDMAIYFPRFVRVNFGTNSKPGPSVNP